MTIKEYCLQISKLIEGTNHSDKAETFLLLANQYENKQSDVLFTIKSLYGGMGSFSDTVLYIDGNVAIAANDQLTILREALYAKVSSEIICIRTKNKE